MRRLFFSALISAIAVITVAANASPTKQTVIPPITHAVAVLSHTSGNIVAGVVGFTQTDHGVLVVADITGLTPGQHGFHIHEFGDCRAADAMSAGEHFNPYNLPHGGTETNLRHAGDMGNVTADDSGKAHYEYLDNVLSLNGANSIVGRSVIVHAKPDDLRSQPAGKSGDRVACGVIGVVNPKI